MSRWSFVFLGLGICVFSWGLQYKLSLYYPPHSNYHQVPEAKLLSKKEQPPAIANSWIASDTVPPSQRVHPSFISVMLAWFTAITLCLLPGRARIPVLKKPWLVAAKASFNPFFFRPPPISA